MTLVETRSKHNHDVRVLTGSLMDQLFDLGSRFDLMWDEGDNILLSVGDPVGLFPQIRLVRLLSYMGLLMITDLRFDAIVRSSFRASISEHFGAEPEVSAVIHGDSGGITMTTSVCSWGGESESSVWLRVMSQGAGLVAHPIRERFCTVVFFWSGEILYIWAVYTWRESFGVLQMTGSLLHVVLACRLTDLCDCLTHLCLRVPRSCAATLL